MGEDTVNIAIPEWMLDKKKVGGAVIGATFLLLVVSGLLSTRSKSVTVETSSRLKEEEVEGRAKSEYHLASLYLKSGLMMEQAEYFSSMANDYQQEPGHYCQQRSKVACLRSFQKHREKTLLAIKTSEAIPAAEARKEIASLLFEIHSIEIAILSIGGKDALDHKFYNTLVPYELKVAPVSQFVQAFSYYRGLEETKEEASLEELKNSLQCEGDCL